jgi:hypothetical protein
MNRPVAALAEMHVELELIYPFRKPLGARSICEGDTTIPTASTTGEWEAQ